MASRSSPSCDGIRSTNYASCYNNCMLLTMIGQQRHARGTSSCWDYTHLPMHPVVPITGFDSAVDWGHNVELAMTRCTRKGRPAVLIVEGFCVGKLHNNYF